MVSAFHIAGEPDTLLATLCPIDERGYLRFGFSGHSRTPSDHSRSVRSVPNDRARPLGVAPPPAPSRANYTGIGTRNRPGEGRRGVERPGRRVPGLEPGIGLICTVTLPGLEPGLGPPVP